MLTFGPIRQLGFVVDDIETAMRHWLDHLGVGPFYYIENQPIGSFTYRGMSTEPAISVALANSGDMQIELIQQLNDAPSAFRDFTEQGRDGLQHVACWTTTFDDHVAEAGDRGMVLLQQGVSGSGAPDERFAYFTHDGHQGTVLELSEVSGRKGVLFRAVADAAASWDGSDPIRDMAQWVRP